MVNFSDPAVIENNLLTLRSIYLITDGVYLWEFLTTLDFDIDIIRGRRPCRWTIWIYSLARITALVTVVLNSTYININTITPINCQAWITSQVAFGYLSISAASFLIVIRIIAIWNWNKVVVAITGIAWITNVVVSSRSIARLRSNWDLTQRQCIVLNSESGKLYIILLVITDIVFLLTILVGLSRWRSDGGCRFGIRGHLWKQGVMWLLLATVAEVPPAVLIILNLNGPLNLICQLPSVITMAIAATRMHRSLIDFATSTTEPNINISKIRWFQTPFNRIHVTVDTTHGHNQPSLTSSHDPDSESPMSTEEQPHDSDKPHGLEPRGQPGEPV